MVLNAKKPRVKLVYQKNGGADEHMRIGNEDNTTPSYEISKSILLGSQHHRSWLLCPAMSEWFWDMSYIAFMTTVRLDHSWAQWEAYVRYEDLTWGERVCDKEEPYEMHIACYGREEIPWTFMAYARVSVAFVAWKRNVEYAVFAKLLQRRAVTNGDLVVKEMQSYVWATLTFNKLAHVCRCFARLDKPKSVTKAFLSLQDTAKKLSVSYEASIVNDIADDRTAKWSKTCFLAAESRPLSSSIRNKTEGKGIEKSFSTVYMVAKLMEKCMVQSSMMVDNHLARLQGLNAEREARQNIRVVAAHIFKTDLEEDKQNALIDSWVRTLGEKNRDYLIPIVPLGENLSIPFPLTWTRNVLAESAMEGDNAKLKRFAG